MYRLRKKSDTKRSQVPEPLRVKPPDPVPTLPPADDFRTSLILPDLTRRFSLLRSSSGTPIALDDLKSKFAEQRARGSRNQVSEEEEDMILEALGRLHARTARTRTSDLEPTSTESERTRTDSQYLGGPGVPSSPSMAASQSIRSSSATTNPVLHGASSISSFSSTKGSHHSRRMSNNLFGSGKHRDQAYLRSANHSRRTGRDKSTLSVTPSESTMSMSTIASSRAGNNSIYSDSPSLRPSTPDGSTYTPSGSVPSSPNNDKAFEKQRSGRSPSVDSRSDYAAETKAITRRLSKVLSPESLKRASMALGEVIRELEEEGDDEIVMERSPLSHGPSNSPHNVAAALVGRGSPMPVPAELEAGTAVSSDDQVVYDEAQRTSPYPRSSTTSPTPRLPGYIPGMPRPMTPRDTTFDSDDQTPSTTPRATSPRLPVSVPPHSTMVMQDLTSSAQRGGSSTSASRRSPAPVSPTLPSTPPLFFNRSTNGRFTPEDRQRHGNNSPTTDVFDSSTQTRRRPISPLSGPAFQPLSSTPPRPSTPSNVTWNTPPSPAGAKSLAKNGSMSMHSRNDSITSFHETSTDILERSKSTSRSLRSPALPDSPWVDQGVSGNLPFAVDVEYRPPSAMSGIDLGSPIYTSNRPLRSPTPTHSSTKSPTSTSFPEQANSSTNGDSFGPSRRSSKQNHHSSFSLNTSHGLLLSHITNSSRSSMESVGSSYHSWDEDHKKDRLFGLFSSLDQHYTEWHDVSGVDKSSSSTPGTSPYEGIDIEEIVRRQTGLTKSDFAVIQDKLVNAAMSKAATPDGRTRTSSLRRRRPSTSQSHYSTNGMDNRVASPTPQPQTSAVAAPSRTVDHIAKASALLESVVDSIESPRLNPPPIPETDKASVDVQTTVDARTSSPGRRQRALADALFGTENQERRGAPVDTPLPSVVPNLPEERIFEVENQQLPFSQSSKSTASPAQPQSPAGFGSTLEYQGSSHVDAAQLALEVRQKAEAATAALRNSPSIPKFSDGAGPIPRRRINPNQISSPTLVSASTSVDTIPLPSPSLVPGHLNGTSSRIGSRFRKLRGTLRTKTPVSGINTEVAAYPSEQRLPNSAPLPSFPPPAPSIHVEPVIHSVTEIGQGKGLPPSTPSPPASATPGLRSFMARFRKQRATDVLPSPQRQRPMPSFATSPTPSLSRSYAKTPPLSAPAPTMTFGSPNPVASKLSGVESMPRSANEATFPPSQTSEHADEAALRQLFDAASNLGLDQAALNDFLARSPSTSSKSTAWTKLSRMASVSDSRKSHLPSDRLSQTPDGDRSAPVSEGRPSIDRVPPKVFVEAGEARFRRAPESSLRPPRENGKDASANPVVRRTIIFPSDSRMSALDVNAPMRKQSTSKRRQSAGGNSVNSNRSVQDRAPTPPPHKSGGVRRFSAEGSPPVPQLPPSLSSHIDGFPLPAQMEQSNSAYDSLYDMYATDSRPANTNNMDVPVASGSHHTQAGAIPESGPALEVIEMANGETIWSIVNGLRDDDGESFYGDRSSFVSEYSHRDSNSDGLKLFFKGHEKKSSKGSASSISTRKKSQYVKGPVRPETKVFFSSSAQIGRLIENLSRGVDAGSFNISPERTQAHLGHSTTSSVGSEAEMNWTVEETLEQLLGSMTSAA